MSKEPNTLNQPAAKPSRSVLFGAAFLMAEVAIRKAAPKSTERLGFAAG